MFCTPSPMHETSREPSLRLPSPWVAGWLRERTGCARDSTAVPASSVAATPLPTDARNARRPMALIGVPFISTRPFRRAISRFRDGPAVLREGDAVGLRSVTHAGVECIDRG